MEKLQILVNTNSSYLSTPAVGFGREITFIKGSRSTPRHNPRGIQKMRHCSLPPKFPVYLSYSPTVLLKVSLDTGVGTVESLPPPVWGYIYNLLWMLADDNYREPPVAVLSLLPFTALLETRYVPLPPNTLLSATAFRCFAESNINPIPWPGL